MSTRVLFTLLCLTIVHQVFISKLKTRLPRLFLLIENFGLVFLFFLKTFSILFHKKLSWEFFSHFIIDFNFLSLWHCDFIAAPIFQTSLWIFFDYSCIDLVIVVIFNLVIHSSSFRLVYQDSACLSIWGLTVSWFFMNLVWCLLFIKWTVELMIWEFTGFWCINHLNWIWLTLGIKVLCLGECYNQLFWL